MYTNGNGKTPSFIVEYLRSKGPAAKNVPEQITIVAKGPGRPGNQTPISMSSRMTGNGVDKKLQPGKVAGEVHEGEMVLSANATQALPSDVRQALTSQAESGELNVDALRQALKLSEKPGYAMGTGGYPARRQPIGGVPDKAMTTAATPITPTIPKADVPKTTGPVVYAPEQQVVAAKPVKTFEPFQPITVGGQTAKTVGSPTWKAGKFQTPIAATQQAAQPAATQQPVNKYGQIIDTSLQQLYDVSQGKDQAQQKIANSLLKKYDTQAANEMDAQAMTIAGDRTLSDQARRSLMGQAASDIRSGRSELIGGIAGTAMQQAQAATGQMAGLAGQQQTFEEGKSQFEKTFEEGKTQFWAKFDEDKKAATSAENWKAFETALELGSDQDVISAYKVATGKNLDPNSVATWKKYVSDKKTQDLTLGGQAITQGSQAIAKGVIELNNLKKTGSGKDFAEWVTANPNTGWNDPSFKSYAQALWESTGQTGAVPQVWAEEKAKNVKDSNNALVTFNNDIDYAVSQGSLTKEDGEAMKWANSSGMIQYVTKDPTTGKYSYDYKKMAEDAAKTGDDTEDTVPKIPTMIPADKVPAEGKAPGSIFLDKTTGTVYKTDQQGAGQKIEFDPAVDDVWSADADKIISLKKPGNEILYNGIMEARVKKILQAPSMDKIKLIQNTDPEYYQKILDKMEAKPFKYVPSQGTQKIDTSLREGDYTKINYNGKDIIVKVTVLGKFDNGGNPDSAYLEFQDGDGNYYHVGGYQATHKTSAHGHWKDGGSYIADGQTTHYDHVHGGNTNIYGG